MALVVTKKETQTVENTPSEWIDYKEGAKLEVYGINHPLYQLALERLDKMAVMENIKNLNEQSYSFATQVECVGEYLVKSWQGFLNENDEALEANGENFKQACLNFPDLMMLVIRSAVQIQAKHNLQKEELKKKPLAAGNGTKKAKA